MAIAKEESIISITLLTKILEDLAKFHSISNKRIPSRSS
ncbi:unnamed protein product, partial [marine sediment metagenome]